MDDALLLQKYHGLGNDYLVLDPNKNKIHLLERHIVKLCRRNIGAGADGILYGPIWQDEKLYVKIFNPDGSEAERRGTCLCRYASGNYKQASGFSWPSLPGNLCFHGKSELRDSFR